MMASYAAAVIGDAQGGKYVVQVETAVLDRLRAMRGPGEDYSDVILQLVELEGVTLKADWAPIGMDK